MAVTRHRISPSIEAQSLIIPAVRQACDVARAAGGEGRLVGGIVRDWLLGRDLGDYDMAVTVPIADFMAQARAQNITIIETGLAHGSVTLRYDGINVEVTQTRADIETDGRHATIGFTPSFEEDAKRRDFTINAIYLDEDGTVHDPLDGMADLKAGHISFIGDAALRITEDYLRILRFIRFGATLEGFVLDAQDLTALAPHFGGLSDLSGERIIHELQKLFGGANWPYAVSAMQDIGLDKALFGDAFYPPHRLYEMFDGWQVVAASCLTPLAGDAMHNLPFSRSDKAIITALLAPLTDAEMLALQGDHWHEVAHYGGAHFYQRCLVQSRHHTVSLAQNRLQEIENFTPPPCPVTGHDLQEAGIPAGPLLGALLRTAEAHFVKASYRSDKAELLAKLRPQIDKINEEEAANR